MGMSLDMKTYRSKIRCKIPQQQKNYHWYNKLVGILNKQIKTVQLLLCVFWSFNIFITM